MSILTHVNLLGPLVMCAYCRHGCLNNFLAELGLGVLDFVDACVELVFLSGETLLTLPFACFKYAPCDLFVGLGGGICLTLNILTLSVPSL